MSKRISIVMAVFATVFVVSANPSSGSDIPGACCVRNPVCIHNVPDSVCSDWGGKFDYTNQCADPCLAETTCGNGIVDSGEQCDDGETEDIPGHLCRSDCIRFTCGQPRNPKAAAPLTSDALFVLRVAVGSASCDVRVCDAGTPDGVTTADALAILKKAVGLAISLRCPA